MHQVVRSVCAVVVMGGALAVTGGTVVLVASATPAAAEGPAPCTAGTPPDAYAGQCATYSGDNTWYGTYGPGFPTAQGWALCADSPASGGDYPVPGYDYVAGAAPIGAGGDLNALGFALSEGEANGYWGGVTGQYTADQAAAAAKLLYDTVVWGTAVPAMDAGVLAAYDAFDGWFNEAVGMSDSSLELSVGLVGGGSTFTGSATDQIHVQFPGTGSPVVGQPLLVTVTGGTFSSPGGPTSIGLTTDGAGNAYVTIYSTDPGATTVTVTTSVGVGQPGIGFYHPTTGDLSAQYLAGFPAPASLSATQVLTAINTPATPQGTVSVQKAGNDTAYYGLAGAVFDVAEGATVVATLTTDASGTTPPSGLLDVGSYTVDEVTAPPGYGVAPAQTVTVSAGVNTVVFFTGAEEDLVTPATVTIAKVDTATGSVLGGAVFSVSYSTADNAVYGEDLGDCTTSSAGTCSPPGNDPSGNGTGALLPGDYQVTEVSAPPGYVLDPTTATQTISLAPGEAGTLTFGDYLLVPAAFHKVVTGNDNPTQVIYAGAVIDVYQGTASGPEVATCTTGATGGCSTAATLVSGSPYCWAEVAAPPGLAGGATGCFTADNAQAAQPITVTDAGEFVAITAKKVAAADPTVTLPGAVFDLYRVDNGAGPDAPTPPTDAASEPGETWVARATSGADGLADFPMQFPGYAYCVVEQSAPANYVVNPSAECTGVLTGTTATPAPVTIVTVTDQQAVVVLQAHKYNSLVPNTGIPGAVYDLYVEGAAPPSGVEAPPPAGAETVAGDTWYARGTTNAAGLLTWTVPAGYAWCVHEVTAPVDYVLDPALHCTGVLNAGAVAPATTIALPETRATVHISATKYNSLQPSTLISGATYALFAQPPAPVGYTPPPAPSTVPVPPGMTYWAEGTSNAAGTMSFAVPAGFAWCLREVTAPPGYQRDDVLHCTGIITTETTAADATIALPEVPSPTLTTLAFTGGPSVWIAEGGLVMVVGGLGLWLLGRRRRVRPGRSSDLG